MRPRAGRLLVLSAILGTVAVALGQATRPVSPLPQLFSVPALLAVLAAAAIFAISDSITATVTAAGDSHTFTCSDVALGALLLVTAPNTLIVARGLGLLTVLVLRHRQPWLRIVVNLAQTAAGTATAAFVMQRFLVQYEAERLTGLLVIGVLAGLGANAIVSATAIVAAKSLASNQSQFGQWPRLAALGVTGAFGLGSFALVGAVAASVSPFAVLLVIGPAALGTASYRRSVRESDRRANIEFLYEITNTLHGASNIDEGLVALLEQTAVMFRSRRALVATHRNGRWRWIGLTGDAFDADEPAWLPNAPTVLLDRLDPKNDLLRQLHERSAIVAPFTFGADTQGLVIVAGKGDGDAGYQSSDLALFALLAAQLGLGFENGQLERSLDELARMEQQMRQQATHDSLTGLANRTVVQARFAEQSRPGPVLLIDLDDFKSINDSLGHHAGDVVLQTVARRLTSASREDDLVARLGGDEFAILLSAGTTLRNATEVAERIELSLRAPMRVGEVDVTISASVGVAMPDGRQTLDELVRAADVALYRSKELGKGRATVFEAGMDRDARDHLVLVSALRSSIAAGHITVAYQPVYELASNRVVGIEALARWDHPTRGLLLPGQFLASAERAGLAGALSTSVFERAARALASWDGDHASNEPPPFLSLNLAATQVQDDGIVGYIRLLCERNGLSPSRILIELTETAALQDFSRGRAVLGKLRDLGCRIALDDFGTGYSSLAMLHRLPIDLVKLDKSFIDGSDPDLGSRSLLGAAIDIAAALGLEVIAEGIERPDQLATLRNLGCQYGQGFLLASPQDEPHTAILLAGERSSMLTSSAA